MQIEIGNLLKVPRGTPNLEPMEFELGSLLKVENRKAEIAYVNKETAPELLTAFNEAYCATKRMMNQINLEYMNSKRYADQRRAIVILDVVPEVLKRKGLSTTRSPGGSEDLRKAVLDLDTEYNALLDIVAVLETAYEFLNIKAKGFEWAYHAVKKIYDPSSSGLGNLSGSLTNGSPPNRDYEIKINDNPNSIIGKPRY
jgi:hypothetical protein